MEHKATKRNSSITMSIGTFCSCTWFAKCYVFVDVHMYKLQDLFLLFSMRIKKAEEESKELNSIRIRQENS